MGCACPVCDIPQADAGHLANHLAFTAMLGDDDHERWLDEHTPGWSEAGEDELANRVVEHADEAEFPQVFEDTTERNTHDHDQDESRSGALFEDDDHEPGGRDSARGRDSATSNDPEIQQAMAEARELTRQRREENEESHNGDDGNGDDDDGDGDDALGDSGDESQ